MSLSNTERFIITAVTGTLMFGEKLYPAFFQFVFEKTGIPVSSIEELADPELQRELELACRLSFENLIKD